MRLEIYWFCFLVTQLPADQLPTDNNEKHIHFKHAVLYQLWLQIPDQPPFPECRFCVIFKKVEDLLINDVTLDIFMEYGHHSHMAMAITYKR